ncbi:nucleoside-diphosphate kinase [Candidatus Geothermarchaeota archaeon]|nr:MAG: nucleoside-diphosphate kinase [Candidatus Geothermarchaeota archaeon]RLG63017.1 MAG: nucleoside-diphosphate kinase [Candidatus Geothermarchaeota archaeon]HEW93350.1 nucleoside-diphosphate kinase [Thermoprotei archaeon]
MNEPQYTLIFLKPIAIQRGLVGEILSRFEKKGFRFKALKLIRMTREKTEELYSIHRGKHFFEDLVNSIAGKEIVAAILEGRNAVEVVRRMIGSTDPTKAEPGTIRGDYGLDITENIIHASDSWESFIREAKILFPEFNI